MERRMSRDELVELVGKILACEGSEEELDEWQDLLEQNVPHPEVSDLMYYSDREMTPEEIVDEALSYRPIPLPPPKR
jgi:hypothetical protein